MTNVNLLYLYSIIKYSRAIPLFCKLNISKRLLDTTPNHITYIVRVCKLAGVLPLL